MDREIATLRDSNTWSIQHLPHDRNETKGRWVYTLKQGKNPGEISHKARYVAKGYSQIQGVDYDETFSPTTRLTSIRMLLQKATNENMRIHQLDVKGAYLNAPIDKEIYLQQPPGYEETSNKGTLSCRLNKSIYGLKQSGRNWYQTLTSYLKSKGFEPGAGDQCVYTKDDPDNTARIIVLFWVDDILICSQDENKITDTKTLLHQQFNMDDRGELSWFLGIDFKRDGNQCTMSQERYVEGILENFGMADCNPVSTPAEKDLQLQPASDEEHEQAKDYPYRQVVGSLIYLMTGTRPDIAWTVGKLSQHLEKPGPAHISAAKRLLRYLKGSKGLHLKFTPTNQQLVGFVDADWAGDVTTRRSTTGYIFTLGGGYPISWNSRRQPTVALSSCEAEYMALAEATKEALLLRTLCETFSMEQGSTNTLFTDNLGAIALTKGHSHSHQRTKHIDIRFHFVREQTTLTYDHINGKENPADILTKGLPRNAHRAALDLIAINSHD